MQDQTSQATPYSIAGQATELGTQPTAIGAAGQTPVASSLLDAAIEVDAARSEGGLGLQEALDRLHEQLAPFVAGETSVAGGAQGGGRELEAPDV